MYNSFFGFNENPFNLTPDPRYLFLSSQHKEAIEHLLYGINERKGFIVITGGIGTGKTTLCRTLLNHLSSDTRSALIFNSFISDMELLKSINQEFGIEMSGEAPTRKDYIDALNRFLLDIFAAGGNAVLLIDEAQNLSHDVLEQIRMLSNLETAKEKLIQIVLVGQPELKGMLGSPSLRQLNERVMVRYDLQHLAFDDIRRYIEHRMTVAGGRGSVRLTDGAVREIFSCSKGNPRRINNLCDRALLISFALGKYDVSTDIIRKAVKELYGNGNPVAGWDVDWKRYASYASLILLIVIAALFGGWKFKEHFQPAPVENLSSVSKDAAAQGGGVTVNINKPSLFLDEQKSLAMLFSIFYGENNLEGRGGEVPGMELMSYNISSEYYVTFKKPFRVSAAASNGLSKYMVIKSTDDKGAVVIDAEGKEQSVTRDYIISNWGGRVSWMSSSNPANTTLLLRGSSAPDVLELQKMLNNAGYLVNATGGYDEKTYQEITRFQKNFGLDADGIAGPRTRALLHRVVR